MLTRLPAATDAAWQAAATFADAWLAGQATFEQATSGSTGTPKTIALARSRMEASAAATAQALSLQRGKAGLVCLSAAYIGGKMALMRGLSLGWDLYVTEPGAYALADWDLPHPPYHASLVPLQLEAALAEPDLRRRLQGMHSVLVGGAPLSPGLEAACQAAQGVALYHTFGMTETVSHIALRRLNGPEAGPWFTLLPGHQARVDAEGCLAVCGPSTGNLWVQSQDRVELEADRFRWLGRADFTINSGGLKLQPEALEAALAPLLEAYGINGAFFITGRPHERLGQAVTLVLEQAEPLAEAETEALLRYLTDRLPRFHAPRGLEVQPKLARTPTGKIKRS